MREDRLWNAFCTVIWYGTGHYLMSDVPKRDLSELYCWYCNVVDKEYQDEENYKEVLDLYYNTYL